MNNLFNLSFWKKFSRFLLIGLSAFVLFAAAQQSIIGDFSQKGPQQVLADSDNCQTDGSCSNPGVLDLPIDLPSEPVQPTVPQAPSQPAPVVQQQPAPSCNEDVRYCDPNVGKNIHKTGGYWDGAQCVYAFVQEDACGQPAPAQPAPQQPAPAAPQGGGQACQPGGWSAVSCSVCNAQGTGMNGDGSDWGTYDGRYGSWCGCAQKFSNINNFPQCGNPAPVAQAPAPAPQQPAPAVQQPAQQPVVTASLPQCDTLANNLVCGQKAYDSCREFTQNGIKYFDCVASQNRNCTGIIECSQPAVAPAVVAPVVRAATQTQTNQQAQQVTQSQVVNAVGGSSTATGGTSIVTISGLTTAQSPNTNTTLATAVCPAGTDRVVQNQTVVCQVRNSPRIVLAGVGAKELPKTGLPILAWAIGAFVPVGLRLRRFSKIKAEVQNSANYLWEQRQFNKN